MTADEECEVLEQKIRACCAAGDTERAATLLLEGYGREILGFLIARLRDRGAADEAFSTFTEALWRGLDGFAWRSSARVWAYALARHAVSRQLREARRRARDVPVSQAGPLSDIAEKIRSETRPSARTETRNQIAQLRERLPADDQTLLALRLDRKLGWTEIAQVMLHDGAEADESLLEKESARLRKRYQSVKDKLRALAREAGLVPTGRDE